MDKHGDIPTLILVIGVFLVCAITILSFALFNNSLSERFNSLAYMAHVNSLSEQARFYENIGLNPEDYLEIKTENGAYNITSKKIDNKKITLYIEYLIPVKVQSSK